MSAAAMDDGAAGMDPRLRGDERGQGADAYRAFLEAKVQLARPDGFEVDEAAVSPWLKPHAALAVRWMLAGGRRAVFASFGLHKTSMQLEACRLALRQLARTHGVREHRALIVMPLGVKQEFLRDAGPERLNLAADPCGAPRFVRATAECFAPGLYLTNYESFREGKIDLSGFDVVSLDEAAVLRGMGGSKTFRMAANALGRAPFRFVATATPSPNEYIELLAYAEVLGVMDVGQAKTRFFRRNSEKADALTLHPHKAREFWLWVASWALFITRPSDVTGDPADDDGYVLPPLKVVWHEVAGKPAWAEDEDGAPPGGQRSLFRRDDKLSVQTQARVKRASLVARIARVADLVAADPDEHWVIWHDLDAERDLIAQAVPDAFVATGAQADAVKEARLIAFSDGLLSRFAAKPSMFGAGCNFQRFCRRAAFAGVGFKFHDFVQAVHRIYRFGQAHEVEVHVVYAEAERRVRDELERRWAQHNQMVETMVEIIREYGLSAAAMAEQLKRSMGVRRVVVEGGQADGRGTEPRYRLANNDCVDEVRRMASDSVDLIVTSIPFSTQYEYSPNFADFGHTDDNDHFWAQMGFLIPELLRVLKPGRDAAIHVKDRIVPGGLTGLGFQTLQPFGDETRHHFRRAGFAYLGTIINTTDVVRENNQTYRLGWSEQLKDGSRMGSGVPEQIILLRKPPSDLSDGYADKPVTKPRPDYVDGEGRPAEYVKAAADSGAIRPVPGTGYSRGRWQLDAGGYWRSSGERLLAAAEWLTFENMSEAYKLWREFCLNTVYDYAQHVTICERLDAVGKLSPKFQLLPPHSWHRDVWSDVAQMRSLNTVAAQQQREKHLCPLPFDIVERLIRQRSEPGELVFDPFCGIGTVPYCALKLGRRGAGVELSADYFADAARYCGVAEQESRPAPTLFDALDAEAGELAA